MVDSLISVLQGVEPFRTLDQEALAQIMGSMDRVRLAPGESLFHQDEPADYAYLILSGLLNVYRKDVQMLIQRSGGDWVGEIALIDEGPRSASCLAETQAELLRIHRNDFRGHLSNHLEIMHGMVRLLAGKLRDDLKLQQERNTKLHTLMEATKLINSSLDTDALIAAILSVAKKELNVERGTVYFVDHARNILWAKVASGLDASEIRLPIGQGLAGTVAATGEVILIQEAYADPRFDPSTDERSGFRTTSVLCVPIQNQTGKIVGVLQLLNKREGRFQEQDLSFLRALSDHIAIAMENALLHLNLVEKERMQKELQLAREIQSGLLPQAPTGLQEMELRVRNQSCYEVGGDYYDFLDLPGGKKGIAIGDVSGKGVSAALIMSSLQAALRVAAPMQDDLPLLMGHLNSLLRGMTGGRKYVTFFFGHYDQLSGELRYVNAGHMPPILVHQGISRQLDATGMPVGLLPALAWKQATVRMEPGDMLLLYTDGLTEAANSAGEEFGIPHLTQLFASLHQKDIDQILPEILNEISAFEAGNPANDDKTLVLLRRSL